MPGLNPRESRHRRDASRIFLQGEMDYARHNMKACLWNFLRPDLGLTGKRNAVSFPPQDKRFVWYPA